MDINISIIDIYLTSIASKPKLWWFLYFVNKKFNKNAKVKQLTKMLFAVSLKFLWSDFLL